MKFSIIMPCYNAEHYVGQAIKSILQQSYSNFEIIIVDDGSTDSSAAIIEQLMVWDERIRLIKTQNSGRPAIARNKGIRAAVGDVLCFLDADDLYHNDRLKHVVEIFLSQATCDCIFHDYAIVAPGGEVRLASRVHSEVQDNIFQELFSRVKGDCFQANLGLCNFFLTKSFLIHTSSICIRRDRFAVNQLLFPENLTCGEDLALWYFLGTYGCCFYIDKVLSSYRDTPGSITKIMSRLDYDMYCFLCQLLSNPSPLLDEKTLKNIKQNSSVALLNAAYQYSVEGKCLKALSLYWVAMKKQPNLTVLFDIIKVPVRNLRRFLASVFHVS